MIKRDDSKWTFVNCAFCGKKKEVLKNNIKYKRNGYKYCNKDCWNKDWIINKNNPHIGMKRSLETRKKISEKAKNRKRKPFSKETRKKLSKAMIQRPINKKAIEKMTRTKNSKEWKEKVGNKATEKMIKTKNSREWKNTIGKKTIEKQKQTKNSRKWKNTIGEKSYTKSSRTLKNKYKTGDLKPIGCFTKEWGKNHRGENSSTWNGGTACLPYGPGWTDEFKQSIGKRDKYICQYCNKPTPKGKGCPHHIDYDKFNNTEKNLVWVHRRCNSKFNTPSKRKHWTHQWQMFMNIFKSANYEI